MAKDNRSERREFDRVTSDLPVRYECIGVEGEPVETRVYEGTAVNISAGGMLLLGPIPDNISLKQVLEEKIAVRTTLRFPDEKEPIQALSRISWLEPDKNCPGKCMLGLEFKEISTEDVDKIFALIIRSYSSRH